MSARGYAVSRCVRVISSWGAHVSNLLRPASVGIWVGEAQGTHHDRVTQRRHAASLIVDQIPEAHPEIAVESHQLQLLDRIIVGRTGVDLDSRQQHWHL